MKKHIYSERGHQGGTDVETAEDLNGDNNTGIPGSTVPSPEVSSTVFLVEEDLQSTLKERVTNELSDDLHSFYGYALDVLCLSEKSCMELISRVECVVTKFSHNISAALQANDANDASTSVDTSFFDRMPSMSVKREMFDEYLRKRFRLHTGNEVVCSNGDVFMYIPLQHYITVRFPKEDAEFESNSAYFQSAYFTEHIKPMTDDGDKVVHLLLYSDEFDVCNPIGVSRSKHKLFAVYFKVLNFHVRYTSNLQAMQLIMLLKSSTVSAVGIEEVMSPLINELNELYFKGVVINGVRYFAIANVMCGDNLSNNFVGGFSLSFARGCFCRYCKMSGNDVISNLSNTFHEERSHVEIVADAFERKHGMNFVSPFLNLPYVKMPLFFAPDIFMIFLKVYPI